MTLDGMLEVFNVLNHKNFGAYVTNESAATYGLAATEPGAGLRSAHDAAWLPAVVLMTSGRYRSAMTMPTPRLAATLACVAALGIAALSRVLPASAQIPAASSPAAARVSAASARNIIPRTANGTPDLQGIWQVRNRAAFGLEDHHASFGMMAGASVVDGGGAIPYQPWAATKRDENFANRAHRRSVVEVLHGRRAANHVPALPDADLPDAASRCCITFE